MERTAPDYSNRAVLLLIAGIPVTVILAATWLWYFVARGDLDLVGLVGSANRGSLVQPPRQLDEVRLSDQNGMALKYAELEPRWTMLVPLAGAHCDASCEQSLYLTRQIHLALGKEFNRVQRMLASDSPVADTTLAVPALTDGHPVPASFSDYLAQEHRGLEVVLLAREPYQALFAEQAQDPATWYLVDPAGWVMMAYDGQATYKDVMADMKFLLKNSSE